MAAEQVPAAHSPPFTRRIGTRLTALVAVTTFATFALAVVAGLKVQERYLIAQAIDGAALFGDTITRATHDQMLRARKEEAYSVIKAIGGLPSIDSVRLLNKDGRVTFSTEAKEIGAIVPVPDAVTPTPDERAKIFRAHGHRVLGLSTPIYNEPKCAGVGCHATVQAQRVLGVVEVGVSLAAMDRELDVLWWKTLGVGLLATALLTAVILNATRRYILKPVKALVKATREIAAGNLDKPVRHRSSNELGLLAESFDGMRVSLSGAKAEIDALMAGLETQVEERTAALKNAQAQLIQGEKLASLGKLSASIAHEINNPLAGILTFSKLLVRDLDQESIDAATRDEALARLRLIERETGRCSAIVRNLLDFARQRPVDLRDVDVHAALQESLHLIDHQMKLQSVTLDAELDGHPIVRADFGQLRQAFVNILLNAVEASQKGDTLTVRLLREYPGEVAVAVTDTGVGIDEEHLQHIFDPFFTTKEKGTGLGLSVVYGIVEGLGGKFEVESRKGQGTSVRIRLPLVATATATV
jgi:two-component system NtrC family sensor kinase